MLSCLCAPLFSMTPTIRFGKRNMPLDCLQPIHTPAIEVYLYFEEVIVYTFGYIANLLSSGRCRREVARYMSSNTDHVRTPTDPAASTSNWTRRLLIALTIVAWIAIGCFVIF